MNNQETSLYHNFYKKIGILLLPILIWGLVTSCGDTPVDSKTNTSFTDSSDVNTSINFVPDQFDAVGTIQGTVIDKATGKSLNKVAISLYFMPKEADEPSIITDTTGSEGKFSFTGVPVNTDAQNYLNSGQVNSPYTLKITTKDLDNYRDLYRYNANLAFEGTGGDGAATNLVSDVTIPLSQQAVTVNGKLQTSRGIILSDVKVQLYQNFNPIINGDNSTQTDMLIDSTMTGSDGSFSFSDVEEKANIWLKFIDKSDPSNVVDMKFPVNDPTPSADGSGKPKMDLGVVTAYPQDASGAFYITSVTPAPGSDVQNLDTTFVYKFNRPVSENEYTRTDLGFGNGTFKDDIRFYDMGAKNKANGNLEFSVKWSNDHKTLTVDPNGLVDAHEYVLNVIAAFSNQDFVDKYGNGLVFNSDTPYDNKSNVESLNFSTNTNNAKPNTPKLAVDNSTNTIDYNSGSVDIGWKVDESNVDIKEYEVWRKVGDEAYELLSRIDRDDITFNEADYSYYASYSQPLVILRGYYNDIPEEAIKVKWKIRAISDNLRESDFSDEVTFSDIIKPDIIGANYNNSGRLIVTFDEPMKKSQVENPSNYSFVDSNGNKISGVDIESIDYLADYGNSYSTEHYQVAITVKNPNSLSSGNGETVIIDSDVSDLAGNNMDTNDAKNDNDGHENEATY